MDKGDIHINYLCNQPFWKFTTTGHPDFCKVCKHKITDFTLLDTYSSVETIKKLGGETCGTFLKDQFVEDETTRHGNSLLKLLLAGSLTTLVSTYASAQNNDSIKTEQLPTGSFDSNNSGNTNPPECATEPDEKTTVYTEKKKKHSYIRIRRTYVYVNSRFPFLHIRRLKRGRISYKPLLQKPELKASSTK